MLKKLILISSLIVVLFSQATLHATQLNLPARGATMEKVVSLLGEPEEKLNAVGQPPITRWVYTNYTLYFEYNHLLHAVDNK